MPSAFEASHAAAVIAIHANATLEWAGGSTRCVFDAAWQDTLGMNNASPVAECAASAVACLAAANKVAIVPDGDPTRTGYTVRDLQPDGRGSTRLVLEICE